MAEKLFVATLVITEFDFGLTFVRNRSADTCWSSGGDRHHSSTPCGYFCCGSHLRTNSDVSFRDKISKSLDGIVYLWIIGESKVLSTDDGSRAPVIQVTSPPTSNTTTVPRGANQWYDNRYNGNTSVSLKNNSQAFNRTTQDHISLFTSRARLTPRYHMLIGLFYSLSGCNVTSLTRPKNSYKGR